MAIQTRVEGTAQAVKNVGTVTTNSNAVIISTGIAGPIQAFKITTLGVIANLAAELGAGGAVETMLRTIAVNGTVLAYQVDVDAATAQLSVLAERSSDTAATLQTAIRALGSNIGTASNVTAYTAVVSTVGGMKFAG